MFEIWLVVVASMFAETERNKEFESTSGNDSHCILTRVSCIKCGLSFASSCCANSSSESDCKSLLFNMRTIYRSLQAIPASTRL